MKLLYILIVTAISCVFFGPSTYAQMSGDNVFLKGRYLEVGIGHLGYYGSDSMPPTSYYTHPYYGVSTPGPLGFCADPAMDGWTTGTPPFMGDYFLPGSPFEGWELQVNGKRCQAFNHGPTSTFALTGGMTTSGGISSYSTSGSKVTGIYQVTVDSIMITQETSLDTNSLYFNVKVTLFNLASTPRNNIYYLRSLDPDNDASWPAYGGMFPTINKIEHQSTDTTLVSATGQSSTAPYLGLGTTDTNATCLTYYHWYLSDTIDIATLYNETFMDSSLYIQGSSDTADAALGLVFNIPHLATVDSVGDSVYRTTAGPGLHPANSACFSYFYAFSRAAADAAIAYSSSVATLAINNMNPAAEVKVYPNPSRDMVNITALATTDHISLYDMMGRPVDLHWDVTKNGTNTFRYDNVPVGSYVLLVTDVNGNLKTRVPIRKQ